MLTTETIELLATVLLSGAANYMIIRERLLVLETKFQYTKDMVEELAKSLKSVEKVVMRWANQQEGKPSAHL